jgi:hypothetical protein
VVLKLNNNFISVLPYSVLIKRGNSECRVILCRALFFLADVNREEKRILLSMAVSIRKVM